MLERAVLVRRECPFHHRCLPRRLVVHLLHAGQFVEEVRGPFLRFVERLFQLMALAQMGDHLRMVGLPVLENPLPSGVFSCIGGLRFCCGGFRRRRFGGICGHPGEQVKLRVIARRPANPSALVRCRSHSSEVPSASAG
jgi:hypothetical protein